MESLIEIDIKEAKSPSEFMAKVVLPCQAKEYERAFHHWQDEMEVIQQNSIINHEIHNNDICAAKDKNDELWYRVRVERVLYTGKGQQATCYFVDTGERQSILLYRLFKLPECYHDHEVPFQMRPLKLWGVQPLTLMLEATETGLHVPHRPTTEWDPSAKTHFLQMTEESPKALVKLKEVDRGGRLHVILFLKRKGHLFNVNAHLVEEEYACCLNSDAERELFSDESQRRQVQQQEQRRRSSVTVNMVSGIGGGVVKRRWQSMENCSNVNANANNNSNSNYNYNSYYDTDDNTDVGDNKEGLLPNSKLRKVISKVHRLSSHHHSAKKYDSDTEALDCSRGKVKVRTRNKPGPALAARPIPWMNEEVDGLFVSGEGGGGRSSGDRMLSSSSQRVMQRSSSVTDMYGRPGSLDTLSSRNMVDRGRRDSSSDNMQMRNAGLKMQRRNSVDMQMRNDGFDMQMRNGGLEMQRRNSMDMQMSNGMDMQMRNSVDMQMRSSGLEMQRRNSIDMQMRNGMDRQRRNSIDMQMRNAMDRQKRDSTNMERSHHGSYQNISHLHRPTDRNSSEFQAWNSSNEGWSTGKEEGLNPPRLTKTTNGASPALVTQAVDMASHAVSAGVGGSGVCHTSRVLTSCGQTAVVAAPSPSPSGSDSRAARGAAPPPVSFSSSGVTPAAKVTSSGNVMQSRVAPTGVTPAGDTPSKVTQAGVTPAGVTPSEVTPGNMMQSRVTPTGVIPTGVTPSKVPPPGVTPSKTTPTCVTLTGFTPTGVTPTGKPLSAGRGRALRKLRAEDVAKMPGISHASFMNDTTTTTTTTNIQAANGPAAVVSSHKPCAASADVVSLKEPSSGSSNVVAVGSSPASLSEGATTSTAHAHNQTPQIGSRTMNDIGKYSNAISAAVSSQQSGRPASNEKRMVGSVKGGFSSKDDTEKSAARNTTTTTATTTTATANTATAVTTNTSTSATRKNPDFPTTTISCKSHDIHRTESANKRDHASLALVNKLQGRQAQTGLEMLYRRKGKQADMEDNVSLIDVGRHRQNQLRDKVCAVDDLDVVDKVMASSAHQANLRDIDLNLEAAEVLEKAERVASTRKLTALLRQMVDEDQEKERERGTDDDDDDDDDNINDALRAEVKVPLVWRPDRPIPCPLLGTMVWGIHQPNPVFDIEELQLNPVVKKYMIQEEFRIPRAIQAYAWPALSRGRNVIGITPRGSGKTTAYLPTLVSELLKFSKYQKLPKGMGPKAVILVPSCRKADDIHRYVHSMITNKTTLKVLSIYGAEDFQVMPLLRGVDLLLCTPHCLLRMLERRYTQLDRLCHLVLDGVQILLDEFADQMKELMDLYVLKMKEYRDLPVTRQVLAFGSRWSSAVADFQQQHQPDPILVFASRIEASVYGRVEQVVHMCFEKMHLSMLRTVVETVMEDTERQKIVIATTSEENVIKVHQLLEGQSVMAHIVHFKDPICVIEDMVARWMDQNGKAVMVVTDNNVTDLRLTSADCVIHFDLPDSQTKFGNRLALMLDYFHDSLHEPLGQKKQGVSHLVVTNSMMNLAQSLQNFLIRSGASIPKAMNDLLEGMYEGRNNDESRVLCSRMKQFGWCKDDGRSKCERRHVVQTSDIIQAGTPEDWLPCSGTVKLRVMHVVDTSHYYVLLLEHQSPGQPRVDLQARFTKLTMDLAMLMAQSSNQLPLPLPHSMETGQEILAAVKDLDGIFHRARVLNIQYTKTGSRQVEVKYVDEGRKVMVRPDQLLKLPPSLHRIPPLAVKVYICRVKPVDGDTEWTRSSIAHVKSQLRDKDLIGNVILRMKNTLWLDPLAEQTHLQNVKTNIVSMIVRPDLIRRGHAHDNPDHVKNLYKACKGLVPIQKKLYRKYFNLEQRKEIETESFRNDEEFHDVFVIAADTPHCLFLQKTCKQQLLDKMEDDLQKYMGRSEKAAETAAAAAKTAEAAAATATAATAAGQTAATAAAAKRSETAKATTAAAAATGWRDRRGSVSSVVSEMSVKDGKDNNSNELFERGCLCLAKFPADEKWYRGQLVEKVDEGWRVFFVDHGDRDVVEDSNLYPIPDQFCKLPAQAMECSLAHIQPAEKEWSEDSVEVIWDLANTVNGEKKTLVAKVVDMEGAEFAGSTRHVVQLYDTCSFARDLSFSQELVWAHQASVAEGAEVADLFPKGSFTLRKMYPTVDAKMADMCASLYWNQDKTKSKQLTKHLCDIITGLELRWDSSLGQEGVGKAVWLVGYLRFWDCQQDILTALRACVTASPVVCASVFGRQLMLQLVFCMEQVRNPVVQQQALDTAVKLAKIDGFTPCMDQKEIFLVMIDTLLTEDPSTETLMSVCTFLAYMLSHGTRGLEASEGERVVNEVFSIMRETSDPDTVEMLLCLMAAVATDKQHHSVVMREKHIQQILNIMKEMPSQRCVFHCGQVCQSLANSHRRNKRVLLEAGLVLIIRELLETGLQEPARGVCMALHALLAVVGPQQQALSGIHVAAHEDANGSQNTIHMPVVKWSQNSFRVLLTISVDGAKETDFTVQPYTLHMRHSSGGKVYGFDFTLYDEVDPNKCLVTVRQRETIMSLAKTNKGKWNRLLEKKQKVARLTTDFDKLVDSSDSEVEEPENISMLTRKKQLKLPPPPEGGAASLRTYNNDDAMHEDDYRDPNCTSDEDEDRMLSNSEDERFGDPTDFIDPMTVMDDLVKVQKSVGVFGSDPPSLV